MIRQELNRWLGMFFFRNFLIVNMGFLLAAICFSLMYYRVYTVPDGRFRVRLLWYFGTGAGYGYLCALLWHPFFNEWMQFLCALPHIYQLIKLTHYILAHGGMYNDTQRPDPHHPGNH